MGYFVYKYVDKNKIPVYVGKTVDLERRIKKEHTRDKLKNFQGDIYYFECPNKTAMDSFEYILINKYHPKYNDALNDPNINTNLDEPDWKLYMSTDKQSATIIDFTAYCNSHKTTTINKQTIQSYKPSTTIISGPEEVMFRCKHCSTVFRTTNWRKTKGRHYSATCPNCFYAAWAK